MSTHAEAIKGGEHAGDLVQQHAKGVDVGFDIVWVGKAHLRRHVAPQSRAACELERLLIRIDWMARPVHGFQLLGQSEVKELGDLLVARALRGRAVPDPVVVAPVAATGALRALPPVESDVVRLDVPEDDAALVVHVLQCGGHGLGVINFVAM